MFVCVLCFFFYVFFLVCFLAVLFGLVFWVCLFVLLFLLANLSKKFCGTCVFFPFLFGDFLFPILLKGTCGKYLGSEV